MSNSEKLFELLENLTGQKAPFDAYMPDEAIRILSSGVGLGYTQLNEILLYLGYDRITTAFFQYLIDGKTQYTHDSAISSIEEFEAGVERFRKIAILCFGNIKYGFKVLSSDQEYLEEWLYQLQPIGEDDYKKRHAPVVPVEPIKPEETYYLGYIIESDLKERLKANPDDLEAKEKENKRKEIVIKGEKNYKAYLASDHLDVYVATSMREQHEYLYVNRLTNDIFSHDILKDLNLRWFDPTQAYCKDRVDKGLAEALMLKRAECTIYLAQESDTFGKDSELASTLAQGKTVIAFIPEGDRKYTSVLLDELKKVHEGLSEQEIILNQLKVFNSSLAWEDKQTREWLNSPKDADLGKLNEVFNECVSSHYENRASLLSYKHPLGIQANISSGVANGVLVVRTVEQCATLIKAIMTQNMKFRIEKDTNENGDYLFLIEEISNSIFRVVSSDAMLTNTFWNYYLGTIE